MLSETCMTSTGENLGVWLFQLTLTDVQSKLPHPQTPPQLQSWPLGGGGRALQLSVAMEISSY